MEPDRKRAMYEDRMSSRLYNFHINEHPFASGHYEVQELDLDDWYVKFFFILHNKIYFFEALVTLFERFLGNYKFAKNWV